MKKLLLTFIAAGFFGSLHLSAQQWVEMMLDPNANFYQVQKEFNTWYEKEERKIERKSRLSQGLLGYGIKYFNPEKEEEMLEEATVHFKRWEYKMLSRIDNDGSLNGYYQSMDEISKNIDQYRHGNANKNGNPGTFAGNWTILGPTGKPSGGGAGRVNAVVVDPTNSSTLYVCTPGGGLWKSTNGGTSWTMWNTDNLPAIGCTDLIINPSNTQIMYLATGDGDGGNTYSIGLYKSTDGGQTWVPSGLVFSYSQTIRIKKVLMDPTNPSILHVGTSYGVYKSTDAGVNWTKVFTGNIMDMEFQPNNSNTIYFTTDKEFHKSTDGGNTYTKITVPLGSLVTSRIAIAVTAADAQVVYLLAARDASGNYGFQGVYKSTNGGTSFTKLTVSPSNILGWQSSGTDSGGQGWYDLAFTCSPSNANELYAGGVNVWKSTNGGTSWSIVAHWTGSGAAYVHADHHDLRYEGSTVYCGNDGGVFKTTNGGSTWTDISSNLQIAQQYRLSNAKTNNTMVIAGHQDNGTNLSSNGTTWSQVIGGDGMECIIDHTNTNIMYGALYYGDIRKSTNGGASFSTIVSTGGGGVNGNGDWVTPYVMNPTNNQELLVGKFNLYKSTNGGSSWSQLTTPAEPGNFRQVRYAPGNTQYIYALKARKIFKSTNGGTSFTDISAGTAAQYATIMNVTVSDKNPNHIWICHNAFQAQYKVYKSTDGGATWTNYSTGLPNVPTNSIVYQENSNDVVYLATDIGIYVRDASMTAWAPFNTGLPNVNVEEIEIQYASGKIRAATYGRSMWESSLFVSGGAKPIADFQSDLNSGCPGTQIQFTDVSAFNPTGWSWVFQGGTPASSTQQNPVVTYNTPGTYYAELWATNANGTDSVKKTTWVVISGNQSLPLVEGFANQAFVPAGWTKRDANNDNLFWQRYTGTGGFGASNECAYFDNAYFFANGSKDEMWTPNYDLTNAATCTMTFDVAYSIYRQPYADSLEALVSTNCGKTWTSVYLKGYSGLATAPQDTMVIFVPTATQWRTESVNLNSYCGQSSFMVSFRSIGRYGQPVYLDNINISTTMVGVNENTLTNMFNVYPNPNNGSFETAIEFKEAGNYKIEITNAIGQVIYSETLNNYSGRYFKNYTLADFGSGMYMFTISNGTERAIKKIVVQ